MPSLIIEYSDFRRGGIIDGRVMIGRKAMAGVTISDPTVSRLHAWIDNREGAFVLTDAGSRTGTFVNGEAIVRWELQHGDQIRIGPVNLTFRDEPQLPEGVEMLDFKAAATTLQSSKSGILFDCACGAPLWVPSESAGKRGLCKYCGEPVTVPVQGPPASTAEAKVKKTRPAAPSRKKGKCGICHSIIEHGEEMTDCPECGVSFHTDCWFENYGCSSYGCAQVNSLAPAEAQQEMAAAVDEEAVPGTPWEVVLLACSLIASLVGALLFGAPAAAVAIASIVFLFKGHSQKRGMVAAAIAVSFLGVAIGLGLSDFWWFGGQHLPL